MILFLAAKQATLCLFEDVHWIDPSTLELLQLAISRVDRAHVMIAVSFRRNFAILGLPALPSRHTRSDDCHAVK